MQCKCSSEAEEETFGPREASSRPIEYKPLLNPLHISGDCSGTVRLDVRELVPGPHQRPVGGLLPDRPARLPRQPGTEGPGDGG